MFQSYVSQDWNYLDAFFSSFSQAYERCPPEQHEVVSRLKTLMEGTKEEMNLHAGYAKRWGVDLGAPIKLNPACTAYCTFLKSTAADPKTVRMRRGAWAGQGRAGGGSAGGEEWRKEVGLRESRDI